MLYPLLLRVVARLPPKAYEFPTGYAAVFGTERFQVGEHLFFVRHSLLSLQVNAHPVRDPKNNPQNRDQPKNIMALVQDALRTCDPELRGVLASNVVLTGGGSLVTGVLDRLNVELPRMGFAHVSGALYSPIPSYTLLTKNAVLIELFYNTQAKIHAPGNPIERRYGGWLGGSILASLGTFHQLWISKEEWQVRTTRRTVHLTIRPQSHV